ncbi:MAG TPA: beta-ketoacyl-ACP synthase II, partial [Vicinamibacterales bacterium]
MSRRVVVTGIGLVSALGIGTDATWKALLAGTSGVTRVTRFDVTGYAAQIAAEVNGFDPLQFIEKKDVKKMDVFIQYAVAASQFAMDDSGLRITPENAPDVGVFIGSGIGGFQTIEREHSALLDGGPRKISPFFIPSAIINLASGQVSIRFGAKGPNIATCTACSASAHAIGESFEIIRRGDADAMIAGGSEAAITPMSLGGFAALRALSTRNDEPGRACRPFDKDRDGFIIGEGAGVLILEELEYAKRRGAKIYAELVGYGLTGDAYHITAPSEDADGAIRVMRMAVKKAGIAPNQVDYINAHGTSTPYNDKLETLAIKKTFGDHATKVAISSTKSMTGHLLGGAGGLEAGISVLAVHDQIAPPTINLEDPDPECDLDYVPCKSRPMPIR